MEINNKATSDIISDIQSNLKEDPGANPRPDLRERTEDELREELKNLGQKAFRAGQIFQWVHEKHVRDIEEMSNISRDLKALLKEKYTFTTLDTLEVQTSALDGTKKFLFELPDHNVVESVWMKYHHGNSVCISSQVGCRMGCTFCASTLGGLVRSLTAGEMLEQIYEVIRQTGERVSNIVVMGIGEPMDNYDNLLRFIRLVTDEKGLNISQRNITVSTCGLVENIRRLAKEHLQITLALSLHATTDELRKKIMPIANRYTIAELMDACAEYFRETGRRITFEFALIGGVNDSEEEADRLAALALPLHAHVNLIPVNPVVERSYVEPDRKAVEAFWDKLTKRHVAATIRREMGRDIDGACGQLRRKHTQERG